MVQDAVGTRTESSKPSFLWTKLFTAFKVALDPKKLLLAALGLFVMSLGWWLLSVIFFAPRSQPPSWPSDYSDDDKGWESFKAARRAWNLLYEMAGPVPASRKEAQSYDVADLANSREEFNELSKIYKEMKAQTNLRQAPVEVVDEGKGGKLVLKISGAPDLHFVLPKEASLETLKKALKDVQAAELSHATYQAAEKKLTLREGQVVLDAVEPQEWSQLLQKLAGSKSLDDLDREIRQGRWTKPDLARRALDLLRKEGQQFKPAGALRSWPWAEPRGPNPLLLLLGSTDDLSSARSPQRRWLGWLIDDALPVLLEPLIKLLRPIYYFFQPGMGFWNHIYLLTIILWALLTWALFGGAITRIAVVQVARPNESVRLWEALNFARQRILSYLGAPLLPLGGLLALGVLLVLLGLLENILLLGEIASIVIIPLSLLLGLIAAVILLGLLGLPLMHATLSAEGSDSFDAVSRSYSYLYQAPWHYLWYAAVALVYGIVTVLFVGLVGSLVIYLARWGLSLLPITSQRELSFLFAWTPTSFGWRELLLTGSPHAHQVEVILPNGLPALQLGLLETPDYEFTLINKIGTFITSFWFYLFFLVIVGFGYSFFWTSSTIIYLLLRHKIDETDLDEVYLEEAPEEGVGPVVSVTPAPTESKPGTTPLTLVEPPPASTPASTTPPTSGAAGGHRTTSPETPSASPADTRSATAAPTTSSQTSSAPTGTPASSAEPPASTGDSRESSSSERREDR